MQTGTLISCSSEGIPAQDRRCGPFCARADPDYLRSSHKSVVRSILACSKEASEMGIRRPFRGGGGSGSRRVTSCRFGFTTGVPEAVVRQQHGTTRRRLWPASWDHLCQQHGTTPEGRGPAVIPRSDRRSERRSGVAFREVAVSEVREVLRLAVMGRGLRETARLAGVDRKTVRRYLAGRGRRVRCAAGVRRDRRCARWRGLRGGPAGRPDGTARSGRPSRRAGPDRGMARPA